MALDQALSKAQLAAKQLGKDNRNDFHRYNYASAEQKIMTGRLLAAHGIAFVPVSCTTFECAGKPWLRRQVKLIFEDGASELAEVDWPIVVEKGRPLDKATAAAHTASLGYLLRDILLLPVVERGQELDDPVRDELNPEYTGNVAAPSKAEPPKKSKESKESKEEKIQREWKEDYHAFVEKLGPHVQEEEGESKFEAICVIAKEMGFSRPSEIGREERQAFVKAMLSEVAGGLE
tara:strand:+ start:8557 stop:9258 length:702 start_codon:yes stop_codon:yes gene_type:complete